ncbi:unnamed protein product, partial [Meganyctiphanes norvegica]
QISGQGQDEYCRTFVINEEDHTLGNALKHIITQNPAVEFCGYTMPHPMERKIHIRIQSRDVTALEILKESLKELKEQNLVIKEKIQVEVQRYHNENADQMET